MSKGYAGGAHGANLLGRGLVSRVDESDGGEGNLTVQGWFES